LSVYAVLLIFNMFYALARVESHGQLHYIA